MSEKITKSYFLKKLNLSLIFLNNYYYVIYLKFHCFIYVIGQKDLQISQIILSKIAKCVVKLFILLCVCFFFFLYDIIFYIFRILFYYKLKLKTYINLPIKLYSLLSVASINYRFYFIHFIIC